MELFDFMPSDPKSIKKTDAFTLSESLPLPTADSLSENGEFGPIVRWKDSRVIRFYRITPPTFPLNHEILENEGAEKMPFVPCSLYRPAWKNLSPEQKKYFHYFFSMAQKQIKVETAFPYLILALCRILREIEIIAVLPDTFYWLWENYRNFFPLTDKLFSDTLVDFCFYKKIKPDYEKIEKIITRKDFHSRPLLMDLYLFDYLFLPGKKLSPDNINFVLKNLTGESFRKSKAYRTNTHFRAACEEAVFRAFEKGLFNKDSLNKNLFAIKIPSEVHSVRTLFAGLPEEEVLHATLNLCYAPILHDGNMRWRCDEIIRYLENRLRSIFKIKNALSRIHISSQHKDFLEEILSPYEDFSKRLEEDATPFTAEQMKPAPRQLSIDPKQAKEIEEKSWDITEKLTQSYLTDSEEVLILAGEAEKELEERYGTELEKIDRPEKDLSAGEFWEFAASLTETEDTFLSTLLYLGKEKAREFALSMGAFPEAMISACNQKAFDTTGDGVIDQAGEIYTEYLTELKEVFLEPKGEMK